MKKILLYIVLPIMAIGGITFLYLGGNDPVELELVTDDMVIYGEMAEAKRTSSLKPIFTKYRNVADSLDIPVVVIDYITNTDSLRQFIGLLDVEHAGEQSMALREVTFVKTKLTQQLIVMPSPEEVREEAQEFAHKNNLTLQHFSIEVYYKNGTVETYFPTSYN